MSGAQADATHRLAAAIEAEARADALMSGEAAGDYGAGWKQGRADALREGAERVRALSVTHDVGDLYLAVLAILDPQP